METADGICDRVSFIVDGKLVLTDTPRNLKSSYGKEAVKVDLKSGQSEEFPLKELGANPQFLDFIKQDDVKRIHTLEATLEEVFIRVTGKSLDHE